VWKSAYKLIPSNQDTTPIQQIRVESFTNNYTNENDIFIKSDNQYQNDTEDSLIPSNIELSPIS
jgi:hypothetical protein